MKNEAFRSEYKKGDNTNHSFLGAKIFFDEFIEEVINENFEGEEVIINNNIIIFTQSLS